MFAAQRGNEDIVKILLAHSNCDAQIKDNVSHSDHHIAYFDGVFHRMVRQQKRLPGCVAIAVYLLYLKSSSHSTVLIILTLFFSFFSFRQLFQTLTNKKNEKRDCKMLR